MVMTVPRSGQVPTLRSALRRARRAGASVEPVHATGEVRVSHGDTRVVVNARRKDSTRELTALVEALEAESTEPTTRMENARMDTALPEPRDPGPVTRPKPAQSHGERITAHLHQVPVDPDGWTPYNSLEVGRNVGLTSTQVAIWANYNIRRGAMEARRLSPGVRGSHITHVRFLDLPEARGHRTAQEAPQEAPEYPRPRSVPLGVQATNGAAQDPLGFLPVPTLSNYARALKQVRGLDNPLVTVTLSDKDRDTLVAEAVRLYWWSRAAHSGRESE